MKKRLPILLLIMATLILTACANGEGTETTTGLAPVPSEYAGKTNPLGSDAAVAGADLFQTNCAACHGPQGHGDGPAGASLDPAPKNLPELSATATDDYLFWRIATGREGTSMPGWKGILTDDQIWQIISFIRTLK